MKQNSLTLPIVCFALPWANGESCLGLAGEKDSGYIAIASLPQLLEAAFFGYQEVL